MEERIFWLQVEVGLGKQEGKVEVGAWRHALNIPDSCHVQFERRRRKCDKRWGKWFQEGAWRQMCQTHEDGGQ